jgi:hypothetical protein
VIDPNWVLEDLDPVTWRAIGPLFMPAQYVAAAQPGEHGLFVLHDDGLRPRVVDTAGGKRDDLGITQVEDARSLAAELYARGEWDRVHVIDRRHLAHVSAEAQATPRRELTLDAYYHLVYRLIWDGSAGYVCQPPHPGHWGGLTYADIGDFVGGAGSGSRASIGLCVLDGIGLALGVESGRIRRVTTLEGLPSLPPPSLEPSFLDAFWAALESTIAPPFAALVCTRSVFDAFIRASDKRAILQGAAQHGEACWRWGR